MEEIVGILLDLPIALLFLIFFIRIMGNKELSQSSPLEFAFMVLIVSIVWDLSLEDKFNSFEALVLLIVIGVEVYIIDWLTYKFHWLDKKVIGEPKLLVKDGQIIEAACREERISERELKSRLRLAGVFEVKEVEECYLEPNGEISVRVREK